jgi:salicylate hydroxylase
VAHQTLRIAIAGGGLGGLTAALAEVGAGLQPRYEELRIDKTSRIVRGATEAGKRFHKPALADAAGAEAYVDREWSEERTRAS